MLVSTDEQRQARERMLKSEDRAKDKENEEKKKNRNFTQTYPRGWQRIRELAKGNPGAVGLYSFIAENLDPSCGAVVADQQFFATRMDVSRRTIIRWIACLEEQQALIRIPIAGKLCAYALDPREVWKGYNTTKEYAAFVTKTLVNIDGDIKRRIMSMFSEQDEILEKEA